MKKTHAIIAAIVVVMMLSVLTASAMADTVLKKGDTGKEVARMQERLIQLGYLEGTGSGANAQSHSHDPGEGLGEFLHERNLFKQTGHQGAHSRAGRGNADERENGFQGFVHDSFLLSFE